MEKERTLTPFTEWINHSGKFQLNIYDKKGNLINNIEERERMENKFNIGDKVLYYGNEYFVISNNGNMNMRQSEYDYKLVPSEGLDGIMCEVYENDLERYVYEETEASRENNELKEENEELKELLEVAKELLDIAKATI